MARHHKSPAVVTVKARRTRQSTLGPDKLDDYQWKLLRRKYKAHSRTHGLPCWYAEHGLCLLDGAPIDYDAPSGTPRAYETDHYRSRYEYPDLKYVWSNLRPSHCRCNRAHQHKGANKVAGQQDWVRPAF